MAQPTAYSLSYDFQSWQNANPSRPLPADRIEVEFGALKTTTDEIRANMALLQRDDGELANTSVGFDQLKTELRLGIQPPTAWATLTVYAVGDTVYTGGKVYICTSPHTSGTFSTDLAASKWSLLLDFSDAMVSAAVDSVNGATGDVVLDPDDLDDSATTNKFTTAGDISKLAGIESGADVTDSANVAAAGALMDGDFSSNGLLQRTAAGVYAVKTAPSGGVVGTSDSQELTNKTITAAVFSGTHTGDFTMSGSFTIDSASDAQFTIDKAASGDFAQLSGFNGGLARWGIQLGDTAAESTGNAGSNFQIARYADNGSYIGPVLYIGRSNGYVNMQGVYDETDASAANVFVSSDGSLRRSTSSERYKTDIQAMPYRLDDVLKLSPVTFRSINGGRRYGGFVAEEVHEAGLVEFVEYDEEGRPDALHYPHMVALCVAAIRDLKSELDAMKEKIDVCNR